MELQSADGNSLKGPYMWYEVVLLRSMNDHVLKNRYVYGLVSVVVALATGSTAWGQFLDGRDKYGGWTEQTSEATGFFRLEKERAQWWFVTPVGNAFLLHGLNHVDPHLVSGAAWEKRLGLPDEYSQEEYFKAMRNRAECDMKAFGLNSLGTHNTTRWWESAGKAFVPYVKQLTFVPIAAWMQPTEKDFVDVFSKKFEDHCRDYARRHVTPLTTDPYLLGYALVTVPVLTEMDAERWSGGWVGTYLPTWPRVLQNLGPEAPAKQEYVRIIQERYGNDITAFNRTYKTSFESFEQLLKTGRWRRREAIVVPDPQQADDLAFLLRILDRYLQSTTGAIREIDGNHLILGNKWGGNTDIPDDVIALSCKYADLVFYGTYGTYEFQADMLDRWANFTDKPFLNGDMDFAVPSPVAPHATGPHAETQAERAEMFETFVYRAYARPHFVGMHWCGWIDSPSQLPAKRGVQHTGLMDEHGNYHKPMHEAFRRFTSRMYRLHASGNPETPADTVGSE